MSAERALLTVDEYFALEERTGIKHEYLNGQVYQMSGASIGHNRIVRNIIGSLYTKLRGSPCEVFPSDLRVFVKKTGLYTYPDVVIICGNIERTGKKPDTVTNPVVLIEVLSPSTESYDRGTKFWHYRTIPTLQEYIVIAQDTMHVEHHIRQADNRWLLIDYLYADNVIQINAIQTELSLADMYEDVFED